MGGKVVIKLRTIVLIDFVIDHGYTTTKRLVHFEEQGVRGIQGVPSNPDSCGDGGAHD